MAHDEKKDLLGIGEETVEHLSRLARAISGEKAMVIKQTLEVVQQTPGLPAGGLYGMYPEVWIGHQKRRRLTIEWDVVDPSS